MSNLPSDPRHLKDPVCSYFINGDRVHYHLIQCSKNHGSEDRVLCPYNANHKVPPPVLWVHKRICPDRYTNSGRRSEDNGQLKGNDRLECGTKPEEKKICGVDTKQVEVYDPTNPPSYPIQYPWYPLQFFCREDLKPLRRPRISRKMAAMMNLEDVSELPVTHKKD